MINTKAKEVDDFRNYNTLLKLTVTDMLDDKELYAFHHKVNLARLLKMM